MSAIVRAVSVFSQYRRIARYCVITPAIGWSFRAEICCRRRLGENSTTSLLKRPMRDAEFTGRAEVSHEVAMHEANVGHVLLRDELITS